MRTALFLVSGLLLLSALLILARLFTTHFSSASNWAVGIFLALWLAITAVNLWVGVSRAGYSVAEELPILLLLFSVPAAIAIALRWKFG
jgi:hypothetical protein